MSQITIEINLEQVFNFNLSGDGIEDANLKDNLLRAEKAVCDQILQIAKSNPNANKFLSAIFSIEYLYARLWNKGDNSLPWEVVVAMSDLNLLPEPLAPDNDWGNSEDVFEICKWDFPESDFEWIQKLVPSLVQTKEGQSSWEFRGRDIVAKFLGYGIENFEFEPTPRTKIIEIF